MPGLSVLLLLALGPGFLLRPPAAAWAAPSPEFDLSETAEDVKNVAGRWWNKTKNFFRPETTSQPTQCTYLNGSWQCGDGKVTATDDSKLREPSKFSKALTAVNGFSTHLWNETKDFFTPKETGSNIRDKPAKWWAKFKGLFTATTEAPPKNIPWDNSFEANRYKRAVLSNWSKMQSASHLEKSNADQTSLLRVGEDD